MDLLYLGLLVWLQRYELFKVITHLEFFELFRLLPFDGLECELEQIVDEVLSELFDELGVVYLKIGPLLLGDVLASDGCLCLIDML